MLRFPPTTIFNRSVPKNAFYKHLEVNTSLKQVFVNDVERIVWAYKLASSTLNVAKGKLVEEITVFDFWMKQRICPTELFVFLDKQLPRHMLFILHYENDVCALINYKEAVSGNTNNAFKIGQTYRTEWMNDVNLTLEGNTMDAVYESLVRQIAGTQLRDTADNLKADVEESQQQEQLRKDIAALTKRMNAEVQPQKKFALHKQLKELEKQLKS